MPRCPFCDHHNSDQVLKCAECGAELKRPSEVQAAPDMPDASPFDRELLALLGRGQKIAAIKLYRQKTGLGLAEAKAAVERLAAQHGVAAAQGSGCGGTALALIAILVAMLWKFTG